MDAISGGRARAQLASFLAEAAFPDWGGVEIESMERVTGGLSWETFRTTLRDPDGGRRARVAVKRAPPDGPLAPYDVGKEARLLEALPDAGVPVPHLLAWTEDAGVFERPFSVMDWVEGESPDLRRIEDWAAWRDEAARSRIADQVIGALAAIQRFDWRDTALAADAADEARVTRAVGGVFRGVEEHVHAHWPRQVMTRHARLWLEQNAPACPGSDLVLVHGDFRFGNWMFRDERLVAVIDWERAAIGDPMQDLGFLCMPLARQRRPELMGMLLPLDELSARYRAATGREVDPRRLHFWVIYWQFVEAALVARALDHAVRGSHRELRSITAYPQLATNTVQLARLIDDYEAGRHAL